MIQTLSRSQLPFITIGRSSGHPEISYVDVDNQNGAYEAVKRLFRTSRSRIATIPGPENMIAGSDFVASDTMALGALRALRVPEDVAVIGFDDTPRQLAPYRL